MCSIKFQYKSLHYNVAQYIIWKNPIIRSYMIQMISRWDVLISWDSVYCPCCTLFNARWRRCHIGRRPWARRACCALYMADMMVTERGRLARLAIDSRLPWLYTQPTNTGLDPILITNSIVNAGNVTFSRQIISILKPTVVFVVCKDSAIYVVGWRSWSIHGGGGGWYSWVGSRLGRRVQP